MLSVLPVLKHIKEKYSNASSQRMTQPTGSSPLQYVLKENLLRGKDILGIADLSPEEILLIIETAQHLKNNKFDETQTLFGKGQTLVMLFEKPSLRTRVTFEAGMTQLGGHAIYMEGQLGVREPVSDVSKNLDRWVDGIMARTFAHETLEVLAANAKIPVINGLSDLEHPCQALADFQTILEHKGKLKGLQLAFIGDGNNVANSLLLLAAKVGVDFAIGCPKGFEPCPTIWQKALDAAQMSGAKLTITNDPDEAALNADVVYTDVWVSMGQESDEHEKVLAFKDYQVNSKTLDHAKQDCIFMHCLPAHRGEEVEGAVIDGPHSVVYDQAENRLHAQKAILALVL
ncbi:MAG: ornithine carbamoyltransferase [Candidatus Obscuribacterales bacterium]|nr:ornithine carbamoyltransferase [Candidatus Obscuribacterales bacterium]